MNSLFQKIGLAKAFPAPLANGITPAPIFNSNHTRSPQVVTCRGCQESNLYWSWNFGLKRPVLVGGKYNEPHYCPTPYNEKDIFSGWCVKCKAPELSWVRRVSGFELMESYGLPHACEPDLTNTITQICSAKCKHCSATDLLWVQQKAKWTLTHSDGTKHACTAYDPYMKDWAEAKRMNYAVEKAWIKSHPDDSKCKKCDGKGHTYFLSKSKKTMAKYASSEPISMYRSCKKCKRIGTFSKLMKAEYLKSLRKQFWPWRAGFHKWKKADG